MKDLGLAAAILILGFFGGLVMLNSLFPDRPADIDWSQQALRDPAADGCPGQYHEYADDFLIECWGHKGNDNANDSVDLDSPSAGYRARMGGAIYHLEEHHR